MTTHAYQAKALTKTELRMLFQCAQAAVGNLESMLANTDEELSEPVLEWLHARLERWQVLKDKLEGKLRIRG
jgi:hypothetical protein